MYGAAPETAAIASARRIARERVDMLALKIERRGAALETDRRRLEAFRSTGDRDAFEAARSRYSADAVARDRLLEEFDRSADLLNRASASRYDRFEAAPYVSAQPL